MIIELEDMEIISFADPIPFADRDRLDEICFGYHINTFDFPSLHKHRDFWEFTIVTEGELINRLNGKNYRCSSGTMFIATTEDTHSLHKVGLGKLRYINLVAREKELLQIINAISPRLKDQMVNGKHFFSLPDSIAVAVESTIHRANLIYGYRKGYNDLICSAVLLILQYIFYKNIDAEEEKPSFVNKVYALSLQKEFLSYHVSDLCEELNYSRVQLNRLFQKYFQKTPHEYLIQRKLNYALNLLTNSTMSTSEIALRVGFLNLSQFNIDFKKQYGVTPGQYRKEGLPIEKKKELAKKI